MAGAAPSRAEVTNISRHGIWVLVDNHEHFLPFEEFPWFKAAPVEAILEVKRPQPHHLRWPRLDIDLALESIVDPDRYPLRAKEGGSGTSWTADRSPQSGALSSSSGTGSPRGASIRRARAREKPSLLSSETSRSRRAMASDDMSIRLRSPVSIGPLAAQKPLDIRQIL